MLGGVLYRGTPAPRPRATAVPAAAGAHHPQSPHGRAALVSAPGKPLLGSARPSSPALLRPLCGAAAGGQAPRVGGFPPPGCAAEEEEEEEDEGGQAGGCVSRPNSVSFRVAAHRRHLLLPRPGPWTPGKG